MRMSGAIDFWVTAALLALALAVGGAGVAHPLLQMLLGLGAIGAAAYFAFTDRSWQFDRLRRFALALLALIVALPLLQLIPLPPVLWHALPGRELPLQIDNALGWSMWRPLTLDVEATIRSFLTLLPAAIIFIGCLFLPTGRLERLLWLVLAFALFNSAIGLVQFVTAGRATPYPSAHSGFPIGLFVNRNHHAALLLVAIPMAAALGAIQLARGKPRLPIVVTSLSAMIVFALVILGTTSRMALALLPVALAAGLFTLFRARAGWRLALPSILGLAAVMLMVFASGGMNRTLARFSSLEDSRFNYWTDIDWTLDRFGLPGSGFGTFIPVYQMAESLEGLTPAVVNHAHNDYLEILLEGGVMGGALALLFIALLGVAAFKLTRARQSPERAVMAVAAAAGIALLLLFSVVDYPLRMPALAAIFALCCALLLPTRRLARSRELELVPGKPRLPAGTARLAAAAALAALAVLIVQAGLSNHQLQSGRFGEAAKWAPWSTKAHEQASTAALLAGQTDAAWREGLAALRLSPISAPGVRSAGIVKYLRGNSMVANPLMDAAAALGWRDQLTQLWVIESASQSGEPVKAVQRAAALFRQNQFPPAALIILLRAPDRAQSHAAIADTLNRKPHWRERFLALGGDIDAPDVPAFEQLLGQLDRSPEGVSDPEVRPFVDKLIDLGDYAAARRVWALTRDKQLLANGGFEALDDWEGKQIPSSWTLGRNDRGLPDPGAAPAGGHGLALRIPAGNASTAIMWQRLLLTAGDYALSFRVQSMRPQGITVHWTLGCGSNGASKSGEAALAPTAAWQNFTILLAVPIQDCPVQRLVLRRTSGIHASEIWIDDVRFKASVR